MKNKKILLINPPTYEVIPDYSNFDLYDFASQPTGLLRIGTYLKKKGYTVDFIDCKTKEIEELIKVLKACNNNRNNAKHGLDLLKIKKKIMIGRRRCGNYKREKETAPVYHCGISYKTFAKKLREKGKPNEIYVTSCFTYHWESVHEVIKICKEIYPDVPIILGGIYATLCPEHAKKSLADKVFIGEIPGASNLPTDLELLEKKPKYAVIKSTRGCPNKCSYCAVHFLEGNKMRYRPPKTVVKEIRDKMQKFGIKKFIFWESNVLINAEPHLERILDMVIKENLKIELGFPEGLQPSLIYPRLVKKMKMAGVKHFRLSLESADKNLCEKRFHRKSSVKDLERAVKMIEKEGFPRKGITVFILAGMPDQSLESIIRSLVRVWELGCAPQIMPFTPIPQTEEYKKYRNTIKDGGLEDLHPFLWPFANKNLTVKELKEIYSFNIHGNFLEQLERLDKTGRVAKLLKKLLKKELLWDEFYQTNKKLEWENNNVPDWTVVNAVEKNYLKSSKVLDIGCGRGRNSLYLAKKGFKVYGVDISKSAIDSARKKNVHKKADFMVGGLPELSFQNGFFDSIIDMGCFHTIDLKHRKRYLDETSRILKFGGSFLLRCFSENSLSTLRSFDRANFFLALHPTSKKEIIKIFSPKFKIGYMKGLRWRNVKQGRRFKLVPEMYEVLMKRANS